MMPKHDAPYDARHDDAEALIDYVADRDVSCPACRYNLRGLAKPRCPECGHALRLTVGTEANINGTWILLLASILAPAGAGLLGLLAILASLNYMSLSDLFSPYNTEEAIALILLLYSILCIPNVFIVLATRRRFIRLSAHAQNTIAAIPVVIDIVGLLMFMSLLG